VVVESWSVSIPGITDWGNGFHEGRLVVDLGLSVDWSMDSLDDWGMDGLNNGWGRSVDNSVESVDSISGVGDGTDGTIGLNKGVLSLDDISVTGFVLGFLVSGQSIGDGISVVVLWMRIVWLGLMNDSLSYNLLD